ncbi:MAG: ferric reductase-like transmembrane domain-containing protein [Wenzhouxiangella sp.]|jgi:predicted ferric reductase|nr:ferric reductase-like transmembrane domain-containing protein [Wenzhouxiangella sp.]
MVIRARLARILVWSLALVPLAFFLVGLRASDFNDLPALLNGLGRLTGVLGLAFLLLSAALSARVPGFDQPFGGLTRLWNTHHLLGAAALLLLLAHPLLLAFSAQGYGPGLAFTILFPPLSDLATWAGWLALALMMVFLAPSFSFFGPPDYERWKRIHDLAPFAVILALTHTFLLSRTMPAHLDIVVWSGFALLAVSAVLWRFVFSRRVGRLPYMVVDVNRPANNVVELTLESKRKPLRYQAGNFIYLTPLDRDLAAGCGEEHPYTLSSSPREANLRVAIKDLGNASRAIQSIKSGARVTVEGPYGRFFKNPDGVPIPELWVSGGIGVTPFLARMRHLVQLDQGGDIRFIYCVQDEARALYLQELQALAESIPGFGLIPHYFYRQGPLSAAFLREHCGDVEQREVYICGPQPLNRLTQAHLRALGVARWNIHSEEFELL